MKTSPRVENSSRRHKKVKTPRRKQRTRFIGTRPLTITMTLRGRRVEVRVLPVVSTTTHVNYEVTISCGGKALDWVPTRAELERIGCAAGMQTERQTRH